MRSRQRKASRSSGGNGSHLQGKAWGHRPFTSPGSTCGSSLPPPSRDAPTRKCLPRGRTRRQRVIRHAGNQLDGFNNAPRRTTRLQGRFSGLRRGRARADSKLPSASPFLREPSRHLIQAEHLTPSFSRTRNFNEGIWIYRGVTMLDSLTQSWRLARAVRPRPTRSSTSPHCFGVDWR